MRNNFYKKSYTKCGGERPFSEKIKIEHTSGSIVYTVCFHCMPSQGLSKYIETKVLCMPSQRLSKYMVTCIWKFVSVIS